MSAVCSDLLLRTLVADRLGIDAGDVELTIEGGRIVATVPTRAVRHITVECVLRGRGEDAAGAIGGVFRE